MDLLSVYSVVNKTLINTLDSVTVLEKVCEPKEIGYIHLVEEPFIISENIKRYSKVVTAHKLSQYKNKIHSVKLEDDITTWLDLLIEEDIENRKGLIL